MQSASFFDRSAVMISLTQSPLAAAPTHAQGHALAQVGTSHAKAYIRTACKLAAYLKRSLDAATVEGLRNFQRLLVDTCAPYTLA